MGVRKFSASRVFNGQAFLPDDTVVIVGDDGVIRELLPAAQAGDDVQRLEGILTPGLINCHCHLELSHLKAVIPPGTGLIEFLCSVVTKRGFDAAVVQDAIATAEQEMYRNGIVAVGDIGNTADTVPTKAISGIRWQNFIEVLSFTDARATENMAQFQQVLNQYDEQLTLPHRSVLSPHAPYSISPKTFEMINLATAGQVISIHNQEHPAEDELYKTGGGDYLKLFRIFGVEQSPFPVTGKSSIRSYLPHFTNGQTIFLVHNTYMPAEDIAYANDYAKKNRLQLVYCLCPNANLYIESRLPDVSLFMKNDCTMVLGTDSYSSNWQLSIAKEIQALHTHYPALPLETILQWATSNGAKALKWDDELGTLEIGKKPGLALLSHDLEQSRRIA